MKYGIVRVKNPKHPPKLGRRKATWGQLRGTPANIAKLQYMAPSFISDRHWRLRLLWFCEWYRYAWFQSLREPLADIKQQARSIELARNGYRENLRLLTAQRGRGAAIR
jgi:hypothetical protein